jgi:hypothetical protein
MLSNTSTTPSASGSAGAAVNVFGTEKDRVNCPFYLKIGACRHGERCSRVHAKPVESRTILFSNLYQAAKERASMDAADEQRVFVEVRPIVTERERKRRGKEGEHPLSLP